MTGRWVRWLMSFLPVREDPAGMRLTIIRHHRVYGDGEPPLLRLGVSARVLDAQLRWLASIDLRPVTVAEGLAWLAEGGRGRRVAMTFDDGYADNVHAALPLLRAHGARATFYLTSGLMERREAAWWDVLAHALTHSPHRSVTWADARGVAVPLELGTRAGRLAALRRLVPGMRTRPGDRTILLDRLRAAAGVAAPAPCEFATWTEAARLAEGGMEIGAHTLVHPHLSLLTPAEQRLEIVGSVALIRERLGLDPGGLAYPGGDYDPVSVATVKAAGLAHAVTTRAGDVRPGDDPWTLVRRGLSEGACLGPTGAFSRQLAGAELAGAFDRLRSGGTEAAA